MKEFFCPRSPGVSRGPRPNFLILNKGAITSISLFKPFSSKQGLFLGVRQERLSQRNAAFKAQTHVFFTFLSHNCCMLFAQNVANLVAFNVAFMVGKIPRQEQVA